MCMDYFSCRYKLFYLSSNKKWKSNLGRIQIEKCKDLNRYITYDHCSIKSPISSPC